MFAAGGRNTDTSPGAGLARRVDLLEARLASEVLRLKEDTIAALERSDRMRDAVLQRTETKAVDHEGLLVKLDRRLSEIGGAVRGLSDEMQNQIRWQDTMNAQIRELWPVLEEEIRQRCEALGLDVKAEIRQRCEAVELEEAGLRKEGDELQAQLEQLLLRRNEQLAQAMAMQQEQLAVLAHNSAAPQDKGEPEAKQKEPLDQPRIWAVEQQISDVAHKVGQLFTAAYGERGWEDRLQEHETRLLGIRSKLDCHDQNQFKADNRVRQEWGGQIEKLKRQLQDVGKRHATFEERQNMLAHRCEQTCKTIEIMERAQEQGCGSLLVSQTGSTLARMRGNRELGDSLSRMQATAEMALMGTLSARSSVAESPDGADKDLLVQQRARIAQFEANDRITQDVADPPARQMADSAIAAERPQQSTLQTRPCLRV